MHELQQIAVLSVEEIAGDLSNSDKTVYVGVGPHSNRVAKMDKNVKENKKGDDLQGGVMPNWVNKSKRNMADGLLLVVPTQIYGKTVKTLIDSGATRCFVTLSCVARVGLKGIPQDVFLELGNGQKYLSRGCVPDVPIATAGLVTKMDLTVTNLLHEVDLVLGMNWLQLVNPVVIGVVNACTFQMQL